MSLNSKINLKNRVFIDIVCLTFWALSCWKWKPIKLSIRFQKYSYYFSDPQNNQIQRKLNHLNINISVFLQILLDHITYFNTVEKGTFSSRGGNWILGKQLTEWWYHSLYYQQMWPSYIIQFLSLAHTNNTSKKLHSQARISIQINIKGINPVLTCWIQFWHVGLN